MGKPDSIIFTCSNIFVCSNRDATPSFSITGARKYQRCQSGEENDKAQRQNAIKAPDRSFSRANRSIREMEISLSFSQGRAESADILKKRQH